LNNASKVLVILLIISITINLVVFSYYTEKGYTVETILEKFTENEDSLNLPKFPEIYLENKLQLSYEKNVNNLSEFTSWKEDIQRKFMDIYELPELNELTLHIPNEIEDSEKDQYSIKKFIVPAQDSDEIIFYELLPTEPRYTTCENEICIPAVFIIPASGNQGSADVINLESDYSEYYFQDGIGEKIVEEGYLVYVIENRGWGERKIDGGLNCKIPDIYCSGNVLDRQLNNLGYNLKSLQTIDALQILQYIKNINYVDQKNISIVGLSLGGAIVQNISVLDDDVNSVVIASGMHSTYLTSGTAITPNILEYYDDPDLISTIAPKPLYLSWGIHEKSMYGHEANTLYSASKIEDAYRIHDKEENLTVVIHSHEKNGGHVYDIPSILEFLENSIKK
tara:strand:- start:423 stop:1607 length:1185 start_codon:yes stop_codon:yes gene_type:complete